MWLSDTDRSFDAVTVGYGLRNVASIPKALQELKRVLRPGAKAAILDFNNSDNPIADSFQVSQRCSNFALLSESVDWRMHTDNLPVCCRSSGTS